jgi:hypothetical protein
MRFSFHLVTRLAAAILAALALGVLPGCGGAEANAPRRPLTAYEGRAQHLFDDGIDPKVVGLDGDTGSPRSDARLRERTQVADATLRVRVTTVTSKHEDDSATYTIGFRTLERVAGGAPPPGEFTARVDGRSPSLGIFRTLEGRLVGMTFVCFVRSFVRPDGDQELHFHLSSDTPEVIAAVREAAALADLK